MAKLSVSVLIVAGGLLVTHAHAATFCVDSESALQAALESSESNGADDVIRLVQGVYSGSFDLLGTFVFEARSVTLEGGYSNGCVSRNPDPSNTVMESSGGKVLGLSACVLLSGCETGDFTVDAITLRGGVAREGGALTIFTAGSVTISNSILTGNTATAVDGGAVNVAFPLFSDVGAQSLTISDSEISDNSAAGDGGGVWVGFGKTVSITDNRITGNSAAEGGGISVGAPCAEITNNVIDGNVAQANEGGGVLGISIGDCGLPADEAWLISGNQITNNTAQLEGGGISLHGTANIIGNVVTGNSAPLGGGLRVEGPATVVNNLVAGNMGDSGAGAALIDRVDFVNNTVSGNAGTGVGGVWARLETSGSILDVINNVIVDNTGPVADLQIIDDASSTANILNNDFDQNSASLAATTLNTQDNLNGVDPSFVNAAAGDYQLQPTSPLVNAGVNVADLPEVDLLGNERIFGGTVDIGAYELQLLVQPSAAKVIPVPDLDNDGVNELALLRRGSVAVELRDGATGELLDRQQYLADPFEAVDLVSIPDLSGNGLAELGALGASEAGIIKLRVADAATGVELGKFNFFGSGHEPVAMATLANEVSGNALADVALLVERQSDNRILVQIRDAQSGAKAGANIEFFDASFAAKDVLVLPDVDDNGVDELGVFATRRADGRPVVEIREADGSGAFQRVFFLQNGFEALGIELAPDFDGNGVPELAVHGRRLSDSRLLVERKNVTGNSNRTRIWFFNAPQPKFTPTGSFVALPDSNGDGDTEFAVLATRIADHRPAVEIKDAVSPANANRMFPLNENFEPRAVLNLGDMNGNQLPDIGIVAVRKADQRMRVELRDVRGAANTRSITFSP
jgi:hypothetical protein